MAGTLWMNSLSGLGTRQQNESRNFEDIQTFWDVDPYIDNNIGYQKDGEVFEPEKGLNPPIDPSQSHRSGASQFPAEQVEEELLFLDRQEQELFDPQVAGKQSENEEFPEVLTSVESLQATAIQANTMPLQQISFQHNPECAADLSEILEQDEQGEQVEYQKNLVSPFYTVEENKEYYKISSSKKGVQFQKADEEEKIQEKTVSVFQEYNNYFDQQFHGENFESSPQSQMIYSHTQKIRKKASFKTPQKSTSLFNMFPCGGGASSSVSPLDNDSVRYLIKKKSGTQQGITPIKKSGTKKDIKLLQSKMFPDQESPGGSPKTDGLEQKRESNENHYSRGTVSSKQKQNQKFPLGNRKNEYGYEVYENAKKKQAEFSIQQVGNLTHNTKELYDQYSQDLCQTFDKNLDSRDKEQLRLNKKTSLVVQGGLDPSQRQILQNNQSETSMVFSDGSQGGEDENSRLIDQFSGKNHLLDTSFIVDQDDKPGKKKKEGLVSQFWGLFQNTKKSGKKEPSNERIKPGRKQKNNDVELTAKIPRYKGNTFGGTYLNADDREPLIRKK
jgi:glutamate synthase domain-containing protein 2